jgi:hypothetical protein
LYVVEVMGVVKVEAVKVEVNAEEEMAVSSPEAELVEAAVVVADLDMARNCEIEIRLKCDLYAMSY